MPALFAAAPSILGMFNKGGQSSDGGLLSGVSGMFGGGGSSSKAASSGEFFSGAFNVNTQAGKSNLITVIVVCVSILAGLWLFRGKK